MPMQTQQLIKRFDSALERARGGDYAWALRELEELERVSQHPQDIAALRFFQATCLTDMGRAEEALKRISRVNRNKLAFSNQVDYEYERARIERALGHTREAIDRTEIALKMIEAGSNNQDISVVSRNLYTMRGILLAESGRCDEAILVLETIPIDEEGWAEAKLRLGDCQVKKRRFREAVESYLEIASSEREIDPIHRKTAIRNIGSAYYYMGEYTKAIEYLTKVEHGYEESSELKADLFGFLASAYSHLGMTQEAAKYSGFSRGTSSVQ